MADATPKVPEPRTGQGDINLTRTGQGDINLTREEFGRRLGERFYDPIFAAVRPEIDRVIDVAWRAYDECHKRPRKRKKSVPASRAPPMNCRLSGPPRAMRSFQPRRSSAIRRRLISGAGRHDQTCFGELSKSFCLAEIARSEIAATPKCYPNDAMGQVNDWMNEIYPRWVAAHGVMIVARFGVNSLSIASHRRW
jgi:hypothetical protein